MSDRKSTLTAVLVDAVSGPAKKIQAEITGIGTSATATGQILAGIGQGIGQEIFRAFEHALSSLSEIIPSLIERGNSYLETLHMLQLETGMTAEQTSTLVGSLRAMGVPIDSIDTLFARLGNNIGKNEGLFRQLGVATRDSNGVLLNSYVIFQNIRRAVSEHGESLLSTAAAQELFGRGGFKLIEALQASDPEWQRATENVRRWGGVVNQQAINGADAFGDTLASLQQGITDIGVNIAAAVDPYLRAFVDSFASFVQSHLNEIVQFAVTVVNVITGFISGLFGITSSLDVSTNQVAAGTAKAASATDDFGKVLKKTAGGSDAFTLSIQAQIKAIDAHTHAIEQAAERRRAVQERARLAESLAAAQAQLNDLRGSAPFLGGLSGGEQALAVQKHAQDIIDAEKNVKDQRQALGNFEADQKDRAERELLNREKQRLQDSLAAHKKADADILQSGLRMGAGLDANLGTVLGNLNVKTREFGENAASSFQTGIDAAKSFIDILLGTQHAATGPHDPGVRTGGLVGALDGVGISLGNLATTSQNVGSAIGAVASYLDGIAQSLNALVGAPTDYYTGKPGSFDPLEQLLKAIGFDLFPKTKVHAQGGWVGLNGPEMGIVGDEGPEYIVPNGGRMPGGNTLNMHFDFLSMPSDEQLRKLTADVSRRLAINLSHAPVTSKPFGAF